MTLNQEPNKDFQTTLSEEEKNILDDLPDQAVESFFLMKPSRNVGIEKLTLNWISNEGVSRHTFEGESFYEAFDYLEYLMVNGYRPIVDSYMKEKVSE
jgi:hypothetical protein